MCTLCGALGVEHHWTAIRDGDTADAPRRRRERADRVRAVNRALAPARLTLSDWQGTAYQLRTPTGRTELVGSLADVWRVAATMTSLSLDPLSPQMIAAQEAGAES